MVRAATPSPINDVVEFLARAPSRTEIVAFRLSPGAVAYLRALQTRNAAGALTPAEQRELDQMVLLDDILSLIRARARTETGSAASA